MPPSRAVGVLTALESSPSECRGSLPLLHRGRRVGQQTAGVSRQLHLCPWPQDGYHGANGGVGLVRMGRAPVVCAMGMMYDRM
eukprot:1399889-Rhodomonas_salina.1